VSVARVSQFLLYAAVLRIAVFDLCCLCFLLCYLCILWLKSGA